MFIVSIICRLKYVFNFRFTSVKQREDTIKMCKIGLPIAIFVFILLKFVEYLKG